jgi:hypothetical protein
MSFLNKKDNFKITTRAFDSMETNHRWLPDTDRRRKIPKKDPAFVEGDEASRPEIILPRVLEVKGAIPIAIPELITHTWIHDDVEDVAVETSLYELCQVFFSFFFLFFFFPFF